MLTTRCEVEDVTVAEGRSVNGKGSFNSQDDGGKKVLEIHINALVSRSSVLVWFLSWFLFLSWLLFLSDLVSCWACLPESKRIQ